MSTAFAFALALCRASALSCSSLSSESLSSDSLSSMSTGTSRLRPIFAAGVPLSAAIRLCIASFSRRSSSSSADLSAGTIVSASFGVTSLMIACNSPILLIAASIFTGKPVQIVCSSWTVPISRPSPSIPLTCLRTNIIAGNLSCTMRSLTC